MADHDEPPQGVTRLLRSWREGDEDALERLIPVVYDELRQLARRHLRKERKGHTLAPTALVHEAFFRLAGLEEMDFQDRQHFFAMASRLMRRVLVDHARGRGAQKRGGDDRPVTLDGVAELLADPRAPGAGQGGVDLLDLDAALRALERQDPRAGRLVELRHFAGLTLEEAAEVLEVSRTTARRDWSYARAFLQRELQA